MEVEDSFEYDYFECRQNCWELMNTTDHWKLGKSATFFISDGDALDMRGNLILKKLTLMADQLNCIRVNNNCMSAIKEEIPTMTC